MALAIGPKHLRRYRDIARLLLRYGRDPAVRPHGMRDAAAAPPLQGEEAVERAEALAADLEAMGPTFVKLGQVLSTHIDLPPAYATALSRLREDCKPVDFEQVRETVEEELNCSISKAFQVFEEKPIAAASLAQVHRAVLHDGRAVAVKVQRRGVRREIATDFQALDRIAAMLDRHTQLGRRYEFRRIVLEGRDLLLSELDYRVEARNLSLLSEHLRDFPRIVVPWPVGDYTTERVLTMDYVRGRSIGSIGPLRRLELNGAALADQLLRAYLHQILVTGLVHADPHPGNVFLTDDGRLSLLDLGQVVHIDPSTRDELMEMMLAISDGRGDDAASVAIRIGQPRENFDAREFRARVSQIVAAYRDADLDAISFGDCLMTIGRACADSGLRVPREVNVIGKVCGNLGAVGRVLDPHMQPTRDIQRHLTRLVGRQLWESVSPVGLLSTALEVRRFAQKLPQRANRLLDMLADNQLRIRMDVLDERRLMAGFQKIANRITVGLLLAAMIVGAAMLVRVPSSWTVLGYPALPMLMFLAAALGAVALILNVLFSDEREPPSPPRSSRD